MGRRALGLVLRRRRGGGRRPGRRLLLRRLHAARRRAGHVHLAVLVGRAGRGVARRRRSTSGRGSRVGGGGWWVAGAGGTGCRRAGQATAEPGVAEGLAGRHPLHGVPLEAAADKVEKERVLAAAEGGGDVAGTGRAAGLAAARPTAAEDHAAVRQGGGAAVPRVTLKKETTKT